MDRYAVYIVTDRPRGVLYTGVTSELIKRIGEHRAGVVPGFSSKYRAVQLVWYEMHRDIEQAILREKRIKRWRRAWKIALIEEMNPGWKDLWYEIAN